MYKIEVYRCPAALMGCGAFFCMHYKNFSVTTYTSLRLFFPLKKAHTSLKCMSFFCCISRLKSVFFPAVLDLLDDILIHF